MTSYMMPDNDPNAAPSKVDEEASLLDIALAIKNGWRWIVFVPLVTGLVALGSAFTIAPTFTSWTQLLVPQPSQSVAASAALGSLASLTGNILGGAKNPADQWIALLKSRTVAEEIVNKFGLREVYDAEYMFQAVDRLGASTRVTTGKEGLIKVEVDDKVPERAASIAKEYVAQLQLMSTRLAVSEASQRRLFFEGQLSEAKGNLVKAELALNETGVGPSLVRTMPEASAAEMGRLKAQVAAQEVKVSVMRGYLTANNSELQRALQELTSLQALLARAAQADPAAGTGAGTEYVRRFRDFKYAETMFDLMARQFELAKVDEAREGALIQVVDVAQVPEWKSAPKRGLMAIIGAAAGFLIALTYVLLRHSHTTKNNPETAQKLAMLLGRSR